MNKQLRLTLLLALGFSLSGCDSIVFWEEQTDVEKSPEPDEELNEGNGESSGKSSGKKTKQNQQKKDQKKQPNQFSDVKRTSSIETGLRNSTDPEQFLQERQGSTSQGDLFQLFPLAPTKDGKIVNVERIEDQITGKGDDISKYIKDVTQNGDRGPENGEKGPGPPQPTEPPQPKLAQETQISGAVQVGNDPMLIVKAPNEETSRYVRPGQYIANDQVLIKEINMKDRPTPTVVLQQKGFEQNVIKTVEGEVAVASNKGVSKTGSQEVDDSMPSPPPQQGGESQQPQKVPTFSN